MEVLISWELQLMKPKSLAITNEINTNAFAVGNDLVFLPNFEHSLTELFIHKVFTEKEIAYCKLFDQSLLRYASTWAAKEAVYKALKQIHKINVGWKNIEIEREKIGGIPKVILHGYPHQPKISLTLSHDGDYAWAIAIIEI